MGQGEQPLEVAQAREVWLAVVGGRWFGRGGHVGENDICCEQVKAVRAQRSAWPTAFNVWPLSSSPLPPRAPSQTTTQVTES